MKRQSKVKKLISSLDAMPTRYECNFTSEVVIREQYSIKKIGYYLSGAKLKANEIPDDTYWYKLLLAIILNTKWEDNELKGVPDEKVWDLNDPEINQRLSNIKNNINIVGDIYEMPLCNFLYASKYVHRRI